MVCIDTSVSAKARSPEASGARVGPWGGGVLKVSRTIADSARVKAVLQEHVAERLI